MSSEQEAVVEQVEIAGPVHLALDHLQSVGLALHRPAAPGQRYRRPHGVIVRA